MAVATVAAIVGAVAALAGTGAAVHRDRQSRREARDAGRDQENMVRRENQKLEDKRIADEMTLGARAQRARQLALTSGQRGVEGTINTSPLGLASKAVGKQKIGE